MPRRALALAIAIAVVLLAPSLANGDDSPTTPSTDVLPMPTPHLRLTSGEGVLRGPDGRQFAIPVGGHVLSHEAWTKIDAELLRLQELETRLTAENASLRTSASTWQPGWKTLATALVLGFASGWYAHSRI